MSHPAITPRVFVNVFDCVVRKRHFEQKLLSTWTNGRKWGDALCAKDGGALAEVASRLNLEYGREYLKIDAVMYQGAALEECRIDLPAVAIEDEGRRGDSYWEMNKLSMLDVPLKVLITYPNERWPEARLLDMYGQVLGLTDQFVDFAAKRKQLVIFCRRTGSGLQWTYHLYKRRGFYRIPAVVAVFERLIGDRDGAPEIQEAGRIWFDGKFRHSGFSERREVTETLSMNARIGSRVYTRADGEEFVRALPVAFQGTYFWAKLDHPEAMEDLREEYMRSRQRNA